MYNVKYVSIQTHTHTCRRTFPLARTRYPLTACRGVAPARLLASSFYVWSYSPSHALVWMVPPPHTYLYCMLPPHTYCGVNRAAHTHILNAPTHSHTLGVDRKKRSLSLRKSTRRRTMTSCPRSSSRCASCSCLLAVNPPPHASHTHLRACTKRTTPLVVDQR